MYLISRLVEEMGPERRAMLNKKSKPQPKTMLLVIIQVVIWLASREIGNALRKEVMLRYCISSKSKPSILVEQ